MEMPFHNSIVDRLLTFAIQQSEAKSIVIHPRKKVLPEGARWGRETFAWIDWRHMLNLVT
jgi:hypothetical protein